MLSLQRRRKLLPWLFLAPGLAWLLIFFAIPLSTALRLAADRRPRAGLHVRLDLRDLTADAISDYHEQFLRSIGYAADRDAPVLRDRLPARVLHRVQGGRLKNFMLLLIILPFFVSYVLRTVSWQLILADNGWVVSRLQDVGCSATTAGCWRRARP